MTIRDEIYRLELSTYPTVPVVSDGEEPTLLLRSEVFVALYSNEVLEENAIKKIDFLEFTTGQPLSDFAKTHGLVSISGTWITPSHKGILDEHCLVYSLSLGFKKMEESDLEFLSIPDLALDLTFEDGSTIGTWASNNDGFEISTPAFEIGPTIRKFSENIEDDDSETLQFQRIMATKMGLIPGDVTRKIWIQGIDDRTLDNTPGSTEITYFALNRGENQQWQIGFQNDTNDFSLMNVSNRSYLYESDTIGVGNHVLTGWDELIGHLEDPRARWRLFLAGRKADGTLLYNLKNRRSGAVLTVQSYQGDLNSAPNGGAVVTNSSYLGSPLQQFRLTAIV